MYHCSFWYPLLTYSIMKNRFFSTLPQKRPSPLGGLPLPPFLVLLLCLAVFFVGLSAYPLMDPDEGRNAEVAREVVVNGHWLPPTINGEVRYEKPPLYYWLVALSFKIWGLREFAARLPSAIAALLGVLVTMILGVRLWGREKAYWAGIILATSFIYAIYAHIVIFDMVLTLFITLSIALFWLGITQNNKNLLRLSALSASLAFLTKGPIGVAIPAMALLPPLIYQMRKGKRPTIPWISMTVIFLIVSVPVFVLAELKSPGYCYKFFWEENVLRYLTPEFHRRGPWFYYLVVILVGLIPWTWLLKEVPRTVKELRHTHTQEIIFLASWILLPTIFFTLSKSKLPHYILPTFPAWALLLAYPIPWNPFSKTASSMVLIMVILYLSVFFLIVPPLANRRSSASLLKRVNLESQIPVVAFSKSSWYTLAFYSGRKIKVAYKKAPLEKTLRTGKSLYLLAKEKEFPFISSLARKYGERIQIVAKSEGHLLLLIKRDVLHTSAKALQENNFCGRVQGK